MEKISEVVALKEENVPTISDGKDSTVEEEQSANKSVEGNGPTLGDRAEETTPKPSEILDTKKTETEDPANDIVLYEAALEFTPLEMSKSTANKITVISAVVTTIALLLFILSFPFSLFLILFCFDTRRSCSPFKAVRNTPWRLYLTRDKIHYHLPKPSHRPYINLFYCIQRVYKMTIPIKDVLRVTVQSVSNERNGQGRGTSPIAAQNLENIVIELKSSSGGVRAPVRDYLGLLYRSETVYTLVIYSVRDAGTFAETVNGHMRKNKHKTENCP